MGGAAGGVGGALGSAAGGVGNAVGGVAGGVGSAVGTVAGGVGGAVGGVAGGVVGAVRSGFGIPRLLGIGRQTSSSPGEEVAGAIGGGGAGLAGKLAAEVTEMTAEAFAPAAPKEGEGEGKEASGKQEGGSAVAAAGSSGPGARARAGATSKGEGEAEICGNPPQDGGNAGSSGNGGSSASGSGGSGGSGSAGAGERGLGGSSCAAMAGNFDDGSDGALSEDGGGDTRRPPRPTKDQAAEADMLVGEAMVAYWASFGKVGSDIILHMSVCRSGVRPAAQPPSVVHVAITPVEHCSSKRRFCENCQRFVSAFAAVCVPSDKAPHPEHVHPIDANSYGSWLHRWPSLALPTATMSHSRNNGDAVHG